MRKRGGPAHVRPSTVVDPRRDSDAPSAHPPSYLRPASATGTSAAREDESLATMATASVRDRTKEFAAAAERAAKTLAMHAPGSTPEGESPSDPLVAPINPPSTTGTNSEFSRMASRIGHGIHGTSQKLERLAQLAKRSGMFDDPAREIAELSAVIKQDITALNTAIAELQNHAARAGGSKQTADHTVTVVDTLKSRLMGATKSFKEVLTIRQENVKSQNARRQMFSNNAGPGGRGGARPNPFARGAAGPGGTFPRLAAPDGMSGGFGGGGNLQGGRAGGGLLPTHTAGGGGAGFATGGQQQGQMLLANQDQYLSARSEALQNVERTITELGGIFQQLATMVAEQGEMAVRIDENVERSVANVDSAQTQLLKYLNSISSNRWLIMKIFGVLISFLVFFVVFVA